MPNPSFTELDLPTGLQILGTTWEIKNFQCVATINSLTPVTLPDIPLDASESEALVTQLNLEWDSPRFQLGVALESLQLGTSTTAGLTAGQISLINISPYPYRQYNLLQLLTPNNSLIYNSNVIIYPQNVGFGNIQADDSIICWWEVLCKTYIYEPEVINFNPILNQPINSSPTVNITNEITGVTGSTSGTSNSSTDPVIALLGATLTSGNPTLIYNNRALQFTSFGTVLLNFQISSSTIPTGTQFQLFLWSANPSLTASAPGPERMFRRSFMVRSNLPGMVVAETVSASEPYMTFMGRLPGTNYWQKVTLTASFENSVLVISFTGFDEP